ncbi:MAG TPA: hypothetical protein ENF41_00315 [Candidatus Bathyarchaeota archaeon]|nr:hypothetical protein [Candidatus Bathyarchaeota archaeon]
MGEGVCRGTGFSSEEQREGRTDNRDSLPHMQEKLGELSRAYRNKDYKNMMEELSDILLFIAKISNILDDYYELSPLENILQER